MPNPLISVIVVFHTRIKYITSAIRSLENQSIGRSDFELIVVGPTSPDVSAQATRDLNIRTVKSSANSLGGKIVDGLDRSSGSVITILEDDDCYEPDRLAVVQAAFRDQRVTYLQNGYVAISEDGSPYKGAQPHAAALSEWKRRGIVSMRGRPSTSEMRTLAGIPAGFNNSSIAVGRQLLVAGEELLSQADLLCDVAQLYLGLTHPGILTFDPRPLTQIRVHADSVSNPMTRTPAESIVRLHDFSIRTKSSRSALRSFVKNTGPQSVFRQAEGQVAISEVLLQLRTPNPNMSELGHAIISSVSRIDTFEVLSRVAAIPLALACMPFPTWGHLVYAKLRKA